MTTETNVAVKPVRFIHRWEHAIITLEAQKLGRIDGETKAGRHVQFYGHIADVALASEVEEMKKAPSFGVDYWIDDGVKPVPGAVKAHQPTAEMMPAEKEGKPSDPRIQSLERNLESLAKSVTIIATGQEAIQTAVSDLSGKVNDLLNSVEPSVEGAGADKEPETANDAPPAAKAPKKAKK